MSGSDLCNDSSSNSDSHVLNAEFTDGQLRIVEVAPFDNDKDIDDGSLTLQSIIQESCNEPNSKLLHVLDQNKTLGMQLDMLNLTLVRCEDSEGTYRLVANDSNDVQTGDIDEATVTVHLDPDGQMQADQDTYVMIEGDDGETMILHTYEENAEDGPQGNISELNKLDDCDDDGMGSVSIKIEKLAGLGDSDNDTSRELGEGGSGGEKYNCDKKDPAPKESNKSNTSLTPLEILEKVKALRKTTALISRPVSFNKRGRKRKGDVPSPHELLASPNLKLYLYSCKLCSFKCNAIKELQKHRTCEHGKPSKKHKPFFEAFQCDKCPNRYTTGTALEDHIQKAHTSIKNEALSLDSIGVSEADILVCGGCGFESASRLQFKVHIEKEHQASRNFVDQDTEIIFQEVKEFIKLNNFHYGTNIEIAKKRSDVPYISVE